MFSKIEETDPAKGIAKIKIFPSNQEVISITAIRNEAKGGIPGEKIPSPWEIRAVNDSGRYYVNYSQEGSYSVSINERETEETTYYEVCGYGPKPEEHFSKECYTLHEANEEALDYMIKHKANKNEEL